MSGQVRGGGAALTRLATDELVSVCVTTSIAMAGAGGTLRTEITSNLDRPPVRERKNASLLA